MEILKRQPMFVRFILTGLLNTLFGYTVFSLLIYLKLHYSMAVLLATIAGVLFNFKTFGKWVFHHSDNVLIFKFILVYVLVYIINIAVIKFLSLFELSIYISGAMAMIIAALCSYFLNKKYVFHRRGEKGVAV